MGQFNSMFPDEDAARTWFERARWPHGPECPKCGSINHAAWLKTPRRWNCMGCNHQFSVTAGTPMHRTRLPLLTWAHAISLRVRKMSASAKGTVAKPGKMVRQKAGLNRAILDQGWGMFSRFLSYKLADRGGTLIEVPAAYTSQTCAKCGAVDATSCLDQARFVCTTCDHEVNADTNAAINILQRGLDRSLKPVEGHRSKRPVEAGTSRKAA